MATIPTTVPMNHKGILPVVPTFDISYTPFNIDVSPDFGLLQSQAQS